VMAEGKIVAEGEPHTVLKNPAVIDAYLGSHQDVDLGVATGRVTLPGSADKSSPSKKSASES
jgi:neutral amino acid transport system ATP-binding protein